MSASSEVIENVITAFATAASANRTVGARFGNLIELHADNADDVMITADLHGNRVNFEKLLKIADLKNNPRRHLIMQEVCHGGPLYPSGAGDMSHTMLEDVARLKNEFPERFHFLLSNHELSEMTDFPIMKAKRMLNLIFRGGIQEMYGDQADRVRAAYVDFLKTLPLGVRLECGVFVSHSLPDSTDEMGFDSVIFLRHLDPQDFTERGPVFRFVWGRDFRQENADAFANLIGAEVLINGHEPCKQGFSVPNSRQVVLDCCGKKACYLLLPASGALTQTQVVEMVQTLE